MNRPRTLQLTAGLITAALVVLGVVWWQAGSSPESAVRPGGKQAIPTVPGSGSQSALYFPAVSGMLELEMRTAPADLEPSARKQWLAEQLAAGPKSRDLRPALPAGTRVASVFTAPGGTIFVDFTIPESPGKGLGSAEELLALYSIVNTMLLGDEDARFAVILINGRQRETFAGHFDTSRPLVPRPDLIREPG